MTAARIASEYATQEDTVDATPDVKDMVSFFMASTHDLNLENFPTASDLVCSIGNVIGWSQLIYFFNQGFADAIEKSTDTAELQLIMQISDLLETAVLRAKT